MTYIYVLVIQHTLSEHSENSSHTNTSLQLEIPILNRTSRKVSNYRNENK